MSDEQRQIVQTLVFIIGLAAICGPLLGLLASAQAWVGLCIVAAGQGLLVLLFQWLIRK